MPPVHGTVHSPTRIPATKTAGRNVALRAVWTRGRKMRGISSFHRESGNSASRRTQTPIPRLMSAATFPAQCPSDSTFMKLRRPSPRAMYVTKSPAMYTEPLRASRPRVCGANASAGAWQASASRPKAAAGREANTRSPAKEQGLKPSASPATATIQGVRPPAAAAALTENTGARTAAPHVRREPKTDRRVASDIPRATSGVDADGPDHGRVLFPAAADVTVTRIRPWGVRRERENLLPEGLDGDVHPEGLDDEIVPAP